MRYGVLLWMGLAALTGCSRTDRSLSWFVDLPSTVAPDEIATIEARILRGGCESSEIVFRASFATDDRAPVPPILSPGTYAFEAIARDDACIRVASGCTTQALPVADGFVVETPMSRASMPRGCASDEVCRMGECVGVGGSDGGRDATADADTCDPRSDGSCRLVPSNVEPTLADPSAADVVIGDLEIDTSACTDGPAPLAVAVQVDATEVCVMTVGALDIEGTVRVIGSRPFVILAEGPVVITGTLDLSASGGSPGAGGGRGASLLDSVAEGRTPGRNGDFGTDSANGGGGGGGLCGAGGDGGDGGDGAGGLGGVATPTWPLAPLSGGSGGGRGGALPIAPFGVGGRGGAGGGGVQISSQASIEIAGQILAGGGGGGGGLMTTSSNWSAGGGGGSGGAVLLEAPEVRLVGSGAIGVSGGGGGGSGARSGGGGSGESGGLVDAVGGDPASSGDAFGGAGSTADDVDGAPGEEDVDASSTGGGGGGGAGCILFRTFEGTLPAGSDRLHPSVAPGVRATRAEFTSG